MILNRELDRNEKRTSQRNYLIYSVLNGLSYMCLGETIILLLAINMGCSDTMIAILSNMIFLGYLLLPLGKTMTARVGAVASQANFWVLRNIAALLVAFSPLANMFFGHTAAVMIMLAGAFFFYGFRAAGVVMGQPLLGEITSPEERGRFISVSSSIFYIFGFVSLGLISTVLKFNSTTAMLSGIIITGTVMGIISSGFVRRIHETGEIMHNARRPIMASVLEACRSRVIRRLILAGICGYLGTVMLMPISMLTLKKGYGVSDFTALLFSLIQFAGCIITGRLLSVKADRLGGRKVTLAGFYGLYLLAIFWIAAPAEFCWYLLIIPFLLCSCGQLVIVNGLMQYFLETVPKEQQIAGSMVISVGQGTIAGILGSIFSASLLKVAAIINQGKAPLETYRMYFIFTLLILPIVGFFIHRLPRTTATEK
ncbi:MAG: MFS transporter [Lentisphaerae bacterium]|nr:MFS transporter [Lentisphaerota bacterium]